MKRYTAAPILLYTASMNFTQLIPAGQCIAAIGGGGKTGLLERLERELHAQGQPALVSVTTRLARHQFPELVRLEITDPAQLMEAAQRARRGERIVATAPDLPGDRENNKYYRGLPPQAFTALEGVRGVTILVEADGSRGLPLKAHKKGEPPLPALPSFIVAVLGLTALTLPASKTVHHPEILAAHIGSINVERPLTPPQIAAFVKSAWGPLNPDLIFLNQLDALPFSKAEELAVLLKEGGFQCALGSLYNDVLEG